jgi:Protein of unknown function (DUF935)
VGSVTAPAKVTAPVNEIGYAQQVTGYGWWLYENETTPELQWPQSLNVFDQMRRTDSQVTSVLRAVTLPVRRTPWRIDPNGARDEVVQLVADDLGLPVVGKRPTSPPRLKDRFSWQDHLRHALLMLPFGHMYFEQIYRIDPDGRRAHLRKLAPRMPKTIERIDVAPDGGLVAIKQYWTRDGGEQKPIPVTQLVAYVLEREGGNWLGTSILRSCYKDFLLKDRLLRVQAQTIERNGMGIPLYTGPENATDLSVGLAMAKAWRAGEAAGTAIPYGATLRLVGVEGTLPNSDPVVRYHDESIARAVLAHFLNLGQQAGTGSYALGSSFMDFFTLSLQTLAQQIADVTTCHVVEDLVDINFGEDEPAPRVTFDEIGSRQAATAAAIKTLVDAGVIRPDEVLEESSRQQYGLPPADPKTTRTAPGGGQPPVPTDGSAGDTTDPTQALTDALASFDQQPVQAAFDEAKHPRNLKGTPGGGRFRSLTQRLTDAIQQHLDTGQGDPFEGFDRRQLKTVADRRGVSVAARASRDDIAKALLEHVTTHAHAPEAEPPQEPHHGERAATFRPGQWKKLDREQDFKDQLAADVKYYEDHESTDGPYPADWRERVTKWARGRANNADAVYRNGPHRVVLSKGTRDKLTDEQVQELLDASDEIFTSLPLTRPYTVMVDNASGERGGQHFPGRIVIGPDLFNAPTSDSGGFYMKAANRTSRLRYVLAHEFGHAMDHREGREADLNPSRLPDHIHEEYSADLSRYARTGPNRVIESYAEAFAEWFITKGKTRNKAALAYARKYGWKAALPSGG